MKQVPVKPAKLSPAQVQEIQQAVFALVESRLEARFFLVDAALEKETGYWFLRIYVDLKEGAISLSDCEQISRELEPDIEALPALQALSYSLEVSSPGLFRPLKTAREFAFFQGRAVRIEDRPRAKKTSRKPVKQQDKLPDGILQGFDEAQQTLTLRNPASDNLFSVTLTEGQSVYLNPVIHFPEGEEDLAEIGTEEGGDALEE